MLSTSQLYYDAVSNCLSADMAELEHQGFRWEQVYPDAIDLGVTLVSHITGKEIKFVVCEEERNGDGDLIKWRLKPVKTHNDPRVDSMRIIIYND